MDELLRKLRTHVLPAVEGLRAFRVLCTLRDGSEGFLVALHVPVSAKVHSVLDDGTWTRGQISNREMTASEITDCRIAGACVARSRSRWMWISSCWKQRPGGCICVGSILRPPGLPISYTA